MSKPRYRWWGYVKWCIYDYPSKCAELEEMRHTSMTANYSGMPGRGGASRATENTALKGFTGQREREYQGVKKAIESADAEHLKFIDAIYFKKTHKLSGAAQICYIDISTAKRWHGDFIRSVARNMGLLDK